MSRKSTTGDTMFTVFGAVCAILATLVALWIGKGIARMSHHPATDSASSESH